MEIIFEGKSCKAEFIKEKKRVCFSFNGYAIIDEHKTMYSKVIEFMKKNTTIAFHHDLRELKGTFTQLNDWLVETFKPAIQLGLKYVALVMNDDIFTAFAADDVIKKTVHTRFQVFKTMEDAENWLDERLE